MKCRKRGIWTPMKKQNRKNVNESVSSWVEVSENKRRQWKFLMEVIMIVITAKLMKQK